MMKSFVTMTAVSALMLGSAMAQSQSDNGKQQPAPPAATSTMPKSTETMPKSTDRPASAQVVTSQGSDQWVASKFNGTDVLGADNKKLGDVSDILFDQKGQILAYIVSVGGFLGMGGKYIALPPDAFQVVTEAERTTTGSATATAAVPSEKKLKISMTEDQLKQAANFEYYKEPSRAPTTGAGPGGTMGSRSPNAPSGMK